MKVARISTIDGDGFVTNDIAEGSLSKLRDVVHIEIVEMEPEEFFRIPATTKSREFFKELDSV